MSQTGSEPAWGEARLRLEDYLRALRLTDDNNRRAEIVARLMKQAAVDATQSPGAEPTRLLMKQLNAAVARWAGHMSCSPELAVPAGLINWFALEPQARRPENFLAENNSPGRPFPSGAPPVRAVPDLRISRMVPLPLANPLREAVSLPARIRKLAHEQQRKLRQGTSAALAMLPTWLGVRLH